MSSNRPEKTYSRSSRFLFVILAMGVHFSTRKSLLHLFLSGYVPSECVCGRISPSFDRNTFSKTFPAGNTTNSQNKPNWFVGYNMAITKVGSLIITHFDVWCGSAIQMATLLFVYNVAFRKQELIWKVLREGFILNISPLGRLLQKKHGIRISWLELPKRERKEQTQLSFECSLPSRK